MFFNQIRVFNIFLGVLNFVFLVFIFYVAFRGSQTIIQINK